MGNGISLSLKSGFSRIPVIGDDLDDVRGILYLKDAIRRSYDNPKAEATETALAIWRDINERNLVANIEPTRDRATVVLHKGPDHRVTQVRLRRT